MKRILFVDDNPDMLSSLRRMLRGMRSEWKMAFADGGREALKKLSEEAFDVIISDIRMPEMDGVELLTRIKKRYPGMVRIALSGQSDHEVVLRSVGPTHQFLAKPCSADVLIDVVKRSCELKDLLSDAMLLELVSNLESLPSVPSLYLEIIEELKSPKSSLVRVGEIISKDIAMTAKILQLVNSAFFGLPQHVSNPTQAVTLLGVDTIKALVLAAEIFSKITPSIAKLLDIETLWRHSSLTSVLAREIALVENFSQQMSDEVFLAGLLHDIGVLVLASGLTDKYDEILQQVNSENISLADVEQRTLGKTHAEVGGYLAGIWGFPDSIVEAIYFHHMPGKSPIIKVNALTVVYTANELIAGRLPPERSSPGGDFELEYLARLGMVNRLPVWCDIYKRIIETGSENE